MGNADVSEIKYSVPSLTLQSSRAFTQSSNCLCYYCTMEGIERLLGLGLPRTKMSVNQLSKHHLWLSITSRDELLICLPCPNMVAANSRHITHHYHH